MTTTTPYTFGTVLSTPMNEDQVPADGDEFEQQPAAQQLGPPAGRLNGAHAAPASLTAASSPEWRSPSLKTCRTCSSARR